MSGPSAGTRRAARRARRSVAWAGAGLFAASLGYFLFSYAVTFGETAEGPVTAGPIATNIGLFSIFALHHSLFARERVRARVARLAPAGLERSLYVWVASLMLMAVCRLWQPVPGVLWEVRGPLAGLLHALQAAGVWLSLRSAAILDVWDLAGVRQVDGGPDDGPPEFKTTGPYGWVRHPIYLGWFLIVIPVPTMTMTRLVFALVSSAYVLVGIHFEERSLRRLPGGAYEEYIRKVPRKLIPGVY